MTNCYLPTDVYFALLSNVAKALRCWLILEKSIGRFSKNRFHHSNDIPFTQKACIQSRSTHTTAD